MYTGCQSLWCVYVCGVWILGGMGIAVAPSNVRWTARVVGNERVPRQWGEFVNDHHLRLKDTRHRYWRNRLEAPNRFVYQFPARGRHEWERALVARLRARVAQTDVPLRVELFATPGSRNEAYGAWAVTRLRPVSGDVCELTLARLRDQDEPCGNTHNNKHTAVDGDPLYRSRNEQAHSLLLADVFPPADGWVVRHEPETLMDLHEPTVVDGVARDPTADLTRSYTCDFVVARGAVRICVESKPCESHVTPQALAKCRLLRDRTLSRVVILCGDAHKVRWYDLGSPSHAAEEVWLETAQDLYAALGV